ncbi:acetoacetyl-CoA synthetase [Cupriavidus gilardii J11]|uniref:Acetoacetyl-CoA synthetase n=1 Tax=Cupriavidus gilardii J11 TaxID=936133 RepID=A0A562BN80_9BURK|nr:acetoacetate--CoA ligase [Cupriavidus gilardii]TWG86399.1 acetoacetyl-CoA synthetase [Cupriavidus gilardii J11]
MTTIEEGKLVWTPSPAVRERAQLTRFMRWLRKERGLAFDDYDALWRWSVTELDAFWDAVRAYFDIRFDTPAHTVLAGRRMPGARWFEGATLNYAQQVFRHAGEGQARHRAAIRHAGETQPLAELSWGDLERQVASLAHALRHMGVGRGDRVAGYLPNIPQTVVAFLATASVGAVWSGCAPDMGQVAVADRFRQIEPTVLIAVDGYRYGGKDYDRKPVIAQLAAALPSLTDLIVVPHLDGNAARIDAAPNVRQHRWSDTLAHDVPLVVDSVPFDHPLWIVYSSGTTGMPKPIVHGHGGIVIEQCKLMAFHNDLGPDDVFHWYSSSGWIMWNAQVAGLLLGCTIALYDGNPAWPDPAVLWRFVEQAGITVFGAGAAFFTGNMKAGVHPAREADLSRLRAVGSTGSPLPAEAYDWVYRQVRDDIWLAPMSGGTDFAGSFVAGCPLLPLHAGEMQCRCLGAKVEAYDEAGHPLIEAVGELVCTEPMPSMPLYLWGDADGQRYHDSYFDVYPAVWRHGDWIRITSRGGAIIYGRSDATINRHGIRMGTSELYRVVEDLDEVLDSMVVDLEYLGRDSYMPLFVVLREGITLDERLADTIRARIRDALSSRHVPNAILQVPGIPRTLSGKKMEVPIKKLLLGHDPARIANRDAMANPETLDWYFDYARRYLAAQPGTATAAA